MREEGVSHPERKLRREGFACTGRSRGAWNSRKAWLPPAPLGLLAAVIPWEAARVMGSLLVAGFSLSPLV